MLPGPLRWWPLLGLLLFGLPLAFGHVGGFACHGTDPDAATETPTAGQGLSAPAPSPTPSGLTLGPPILGGLFGLAFLIRRFRG